MSRKKDTSNYKEAAKHRPQTWKPGQSGNPKGRQPVAESMTGILRTLSEMTAAEILDWLPADNPLGQAYKDMPQHVPMRTLLMLRIINSQMFDPNGVMTREIFDRLEGRVPFRAEVDGKLTVENLAGMLDRVYGDVIEAAAEDVKQLEDGTDEQ